MHEVIFVKTDEEYMAAAALFREYAIWLNIDLSFQKFEEELSQLKSIYATPYGGIILIKLNDKYVACVAVRKHKKDTAELKRMYVQTSVQRKGIGSLLLREALIIAKDCGYKKMLLDTLSIMEPAINLYKKNGFVEIPAYYHNPQETAVFFEKKI
jgi:carbonic anhydrase